MDSPIEKPQDKTDYRNYLSFGDSPKNNKVIKRGILDEKSPTIVYRYLTALK